MDIMSQKGQSKQGKTLKKWGLLVGIFKAALVMGLGLGAFVGVIVLVLHFTGGLYADAPAGEAPLIVLSLALGTMAFVFVVHFIPTMRNISRISAQEKTLEFCFDDEMKKLNVTHFKPFLKGTLMVIKPNYVSPEWFVAFNGGIAFRRDFILQLEKHEKRMASVTRSVTRGQLILSCADGKKRRVTTVHSVINELETWLSEVK